MKQRTGLIAISMAISLGSWAQNAEGGISAKMLDEIKSAQQLSPAQKVIANAMAGNSIDALAKKYNNSATLDTHFSIETDKQSITDQKSSGRCWMFSGLNVLRADYAKRTDSLRVELSQAYLFFWDQLEKANLFLQGIINTAAKPIDDQRVQFFFKNPLNDGGTFCGVADLTDKYGLVPKEVMPETYSTENTARMSRILDAKLREYGLALRKMVAEGKKSKAIESEKTKMLATVYRVLAMTMGEPPTSFEYAMKDKDKKAVTEKKTYTPLTFAQEVVGRQLNGSFIMVMNDPRRPYYKTYEVELDRHTQDGHNWKYINLPMEDIADMAIKSLKDGRKLYSSYDVGKMLDKSNGYGDTENYDYGALFGIDFSMDKAERISTFDSGSTHAMTLCAVDLDDNGKPVKWKVENSWGANWGQKGCMIMTHRWVEEYMFRLVVDKKYVPENILKMNEQAPVMVMPEDPLFQNDQP